MNRLLGFHGLLLLLGTLMAWTSWHRVDPSDPRARTLVLEVERDELIGLEHHWPGGLTRVEPLHSGDVHDMRLRLRPAAQPLPGEDPAYTPAPAEVVAPASHVVERGLALLSPLRAQRVYGEPDSRQIARLGFAERERHMRIETTAGPIDIEFGIETFGGDGRYIRIAGRPQVYLVDAQLARSFEGPATRLTDARLVPIELAQVETLTVRMDGRELRLHQQHAEQPTLRRFVDATDKTLVVPGGESIIMSLRGLFSRSWVDPTQVRGSAVLSIQIGMDRRPPLAIALHQAPTDDLWWLRSGAWAAELHPVAARKLLEDLRAALPLSR